MRPFIVFFIPGVVAGVAGLLLVQQFVSGPSGGRASVDAPAWNAADRPQVTAEVSRAKIASLEEENVKLRDEMGKSGAAAAEVRAEPEDEKDDEAKAGESMIEFMMAMGERKARQQIEIEVGKMAERFGLSEQQTEQLRMALTEKLESQQLAGKRIMKGEASLEDLVKSDEHNFARFDETVTKLLSDQQLESYAAYQEEREFKRIEKKSTEDLNGLDQVAGLTPEQKELAFEVFAELNAADKPGEVPEGVTPEQFGNFIDGEIGKRLDRLDPILDENQLAAYEAQTRVFREMVFKMVGKATGGSPAAAD